MTVLMRFWSRKGHNFRGILVVYMLTRNGKIVFTLFLLGVVVICGVLFLKSSPIADLLPSSPAITNEAPFTPSMEMLTYLNNPLSTFKIDADTLESGVHFSPDGRFALFQANSKPVTGQLEQGQRVVLVDISNGMMKKIYDGALVGKPSWSNNFVVFSSDGVYIYNLKDGVLNAVSSFGSYPVISSDSLFVAYKNTNEGGVFVYSVESRNTSNLTKDTHDTPALWLQDSTDLLIFKSDGMDLGEGAGERQFVARVDTVTKSIKEYVSVPRGRFFDAMSLGDESVFVAGGFDDGRSDYILNLKNDTTVTLHQNVSVSEVLIDVFSQNVFVYSQNSITAYNHLGEKTGSVTLVNPPNVDMSKKMPLGFHMDEKSVWLSYVSGNPLRSTIRQWNFGTGEFVNEYLSDNGAVTFFSETSLYAVPSEDRASVIFNILN